MNNRDMGKKSGMSVKKMADGGMVDDKERGLAASAGEKVGFWERIKAGNIDDPNSEAYKRWGAGRGASERSADAADARMNTTSMMEANSSPAPASAPTPAKAETPTVAEQGVPEGMIGPADTSAPKAVVKDEVKKPSSMPKPKSRPTGGAAGGLANGYSLGEGMRAARAQDAKAAEKPAAAPAVNPRNTTPLSTSPEQKKRIDSGAAMDEVPLVRGIKKFGEWLSTPKGPAQTMNQRAYDEADKRKSASNPTGSIYGMANGGLVGGDKGRMYGKKC